MEQHNLQYFLLFYNYYYCYRLRIVYKQFQLSISETSTKSIVLFSNQIQYFVVIFVNILYYYMRFEPRYRSSLMIDRFTPVGNFFFALPFCQRLQFNSIWTQPLSLIVIFLFFIHFNFNTVEYCCIYSICFIRL